MRLSVTLLVLLCISVFAITSVAAMDATVDIWYSDSIPQTKTFSTGAFSGHNEELDLVVYRGVEYRSLIGVFDLNPEYWWAVEERFFDGIPSSYCWDGRDMGGDLTLHPNAHCTPKFFDQACSGTCPVQVFEGMYIVTWGSLSGLEAEGVMRINVYSTFDHTYPTITVNDGLLVGGQPAREPGRTRFTISCTGPNSGCAQDEIYYKFEECSGFSQSSVYLNQYPQHFGSGWIPYSRNEVLEVTEDTPLCVIARNKGWQRYLDENVYAQQISTEITVDPVEVTTCEGEGPEFPCEDRSWDGNGYYCSDGTPDSTGPGHCCRPGWYWDESGGRCEQYDQCYPGPDPWGLDACPHDPVSKPEEYWSDERCINTARSCCPVAPAPYDLEGQPFYDNRNLGKSTVSINGITRLEEISVCSGTYYGGDNFQEIVECGVADGICPEDYDHRQCAVCDPDCAGVHPSCAGETRGGTVCGTNCQPLPSCTPGTSCGGAFLIGNTCSFDRTYTSSCSCSSRSDYCPAAGTTNSGVCYYGSRTCSNSEGCGLDTCTLQSGETCHATDGCVEETVCTAISCSGTTPSGSGVSRGDLSYCQEDGHTPTSWTWRASGSLNACEWSCQAGFTRYRDTHTCIPVETPATCGPSSQPSGEGIVTGPPTYTAPHSPWDWTYTSSSSPNACQWTCQTGYTRDGNSCVQVPTTACTGTAPSGPQYDLGGSAYPDGHTPTSWTRVSSNPDFCEWTCASGYEWDGANCVEETFDCGTGNLPSDLTGVHQGSSTYTQGHTPTSWTRVTTSPNACQWRCESGYTYDSSTNTCQQSEDIQSCDGTLPSGSAVIAGPDEYDALTYTGPTDWEHTESSSPNTCQYTCAEGYAYDQGACIADIEVSLSANPSFGVAPLAVDFEYDITSPESGFTFWIDYGDSTTSGTYGPWPYETASSTAVEFSRTYANQGTFEAELIVTFNGNEYRSGPVTISTTCAGPGQSADEALNCCMPEGTDLGTCYYNGQCLAPDTCPIGGFEEGGLICDPSLRDGDLSITGMIDRDASQNHAGTPHPTCPAGVWITEGFCLDEDGTTNACDTYQPGRQLTTEGMLTEFMCGDDPGEQYEQFTDPQSGELVDICVFTEDIPPPPPQSCSGDTPVIFVETGSGDEEGTWTHAEHNNPLAACEFRCAPGYEFDEDAMQCYEEGTPPPENYCDGTPPSGDFDVGPNGFDDPSYTPSEWTRVEHEEDLAACEFRCADGEPFNEETNTCGTTPPTGSCSCPVWEGENPQLRAAYGQWVDGVCELQRSCDDPWQAMSCDDGDQRAFRHPTCFADISGTVVYYESDDRTISEPALPGTRVNAEVEMRDGTTSERISVLVSRETHESTYSLRTPAGEVTLWAEFDTLIGLPETLEDVDLADDIGDVSLELHTRVCNDDCTNHLGLCDRGCLGVGGCPAEGSFDNDLTGQLFDVCAPPTASVGLEQGALMLVDRNETHRLVGNCCVLAEEEPDNMEPPVWEPAPQAVIEGNVSNLIKYTRLVVVDGYPLRLVVASWN